MRLYTATRMHSSGNRCFPLQLLECICLLEPAARAASAQPTPSVGAAPSSPRAHDELKTSSRRAREHKVAEAHEAITRLALGQRAARIDRRLVGVGVGGWGLGVGLVQVLRSRVEHCASK